MDIVRTGDGIGANSFYGYSYTITFWGAYGSHNIPELIVNPGVDGFVSPKISSFVHTLQQSEKFEEFGHRYIALEAATRYDFRVRAVNRMGISAPSAEVAAWTERFGGLPGHHSQLPWVFMPLLHRYLYIINHPFITEGLLSINTLLKWIEMMHLTQHQTHTTQWLKKILRRSNK